LIENPVALIDKNVDKHGAREVAEAFVNFLRSQDGQRGYAKYGLRPVVPTAVSAEVLAQFPPVQDLWKIDYLGAGRRPKRCGLWAFTRRS
jgi:sulfate transport system substrate-binding protein